MIRAYASLSSREMPRRSDEDAATEILELLTSDQVEPPAACLADGGSVAELAARR